MHALRYALSSFPYSKTSSEACIFFIPCFAFFPLPNAMATPFSSKRSGVEMEVLILHRKT